MSNLKISDNTPDPWTLKMMEFTAKTNASMRKLGIQGIGGFINPATGEIFCQSVDGAEVPEEFKQLIQSKLNTENNNDQ
jgi:hypothetical protein